MNTYLKDQPPGIQFVAFLGLATGFFVITILITSLCFDSLSAVLLNTKAVITPEVVAEFKWAQVISAFMSFVLPGILFGYFSSPKALQYVGLHKNVSLSLVILCIGLLIVVQPFVGWLGNINAKANFGSLQKFLQESEMRYTRALETFLKMRNPLDLVINLFIMGLLPAVGEELFFRGALQKSLLRWSKIPWLAIVLSSAVFALLHGTFFKVLPIFTLGLMLGTIYYVTRNLWYCIIIHFLNNSLAVMAVYFADRNATIKKFADDNISLPIYLAFISLALVIGIILVMKKRSDTLLPTHLSNELTAGSE